MHCGARSHSGDIAQSCKIAASYICYKQGYLRRGITCRPCAGTQQASRMGYYDGQYKRIVICCDNIHSEKQLESTLVHELVHAFDRIRTGTFSTMCHLIACGEIRASALGQCHDIKSPQRKRECIWEDAIRSTAVHCGGRTTAEMYIRQVFDKCVQDTAPFTIAQQ